ncbi:MAG: IS200/IS605 family element transposase accessory protein TnpB [Acidobacteria bacterium]|nr:IS200/IS605 family element transposase accessory protein TnpB [Acidobacteriota bacterium]
MKVNKAFKYRIFPNDEQKKNLAQTFGCVRLTFNTMLAARTKAWQQNKQHLSYHDTAQMLTTLKKQEDRIFLNDVSSVCLQQTLRNLDCAFRNFFAGRAKYPTFKKANSNQSARYANNAFKFADGKLTLARQTEPLEISWSRPLPDDAKINSLTISKDTTSRYFISIHFETDWSPLEDLQTSVGIDVGTKTLAVLSNGENLENPKFLPLAEKRIKKLQRRVYKKVKGSNNRRKAKLKLARADASVADKRQDYIHQFTTKTIRENQTIIVEGFSVANLLKNHCLAKSIANASWGEMFRQLEYKAEWNGRKYLELDRFFPSSKICSSCSHLLVKLPLSVRVWDCPNCSTHHDRDLNAAKNIEIAGQYLLCSESDARKLTPKRYDSR